jgi:hypothetical protein
MNMKRVILLTACQLLIIVGCDWSIMDGNFGDPYYQIVPDSSGISSVLLRLSADTVFYRPGSVAEISGYGEVRNYYHDPLQGIPLGFCVSDSSASLVWTDAALQDTTNTNGRVNFTLRCADCAGEVAVTIRSGWGVDYVVFMPENRRPVYLAGLALPDTLYTDSLHADSLTLRLSVMDGDHHPISGFTVRSVFLNCDPLDCHRNRVRTNLTGVVSADFVYAFQIPWPYTYCFPFFVAGLRDSICVTFMPWDSTYGG